MQSTNSSFFAEHFSCNCLKISVCSFTSWHETKLNLINVQMLSHQLCIAILGILKSNMLISVPLQFLLSKHSPSPYNGLKLSSYSVGITPPTVIEFTRPVIMSTSTSPAAFTISHTKNTGSAAFPYFDLLISTLIRWSSSIKPGTLMTVSVWDKLFLSHAISMFKSFSMITFPDYFLIFITDYPNISSVLTHGSPETSWLVLNIPLAILNTLTFPNLFLSDLHLIW